MAEYLKSPDTIPVIGGGLDLAGNLVGKLGKKLKAPKKSKYAPASIPSPIDLLGIPESLERAGASLQDMAHGFSPLHGGSLQTGSIDPRVLDVLNLAPAVGPTISAAKSIGLKGLEAAHEGITYGRGPMAYMQQYAPSVVKPVGGNWLEGGNGFTQFDNAISSVSRIGEGTPWDTSVFEIGKTGDVLDDKMYNMVRDYLKKRWGSPDDEIRQLADQGIMMKPSYSMIVPTNRAHGGDIPLENTATTEQGKAWENIADFNIHARPAKLYRPNSTHTHLLKEADLPIKDLYPWLSKVPPEEKVYSLHDFNVYNGQELIEKLGFNHMYDTLKELVDSGRMTPDQLKQLNMSRAVQLTHEATIAAEAGAAEAEVTGYAKNLQLPKLKEYPSGHFIAELPDAASSPESLDTVRRVGKQGGWCTQDTSAAKDYGSGESKLHTIFDKEGRPHIQLEISSEGTKPSIHQMKPPGNDWDSARSLEYHKRDNNYVPELQSIMQDVVKSGDWGEVRDLSNAGLYKPTDHPNYLTESEYAEFMKTPKDPEKFKNGGRVVGHENQYVKKAGAFSRKSQQWAAGLIPGLQPIITDANQPYYPKDTEHNGAGDAMRHLLFQAGLVNHYGETPASIIGWLHEASSLGQPDAEYDMDAHNDGLGRQLGGLGLTKEEVVRRAKGLIDSGAARTLPQGEDGYKDGGGVDTDKANFRLSEPQDNSIAAIIQQIKDIGNPNIMKRIDDTTLADTKDIAMALVTMKPSEYTPSKATTFLNEFNASTQPHPFNPRARDIGGKAFVEVYPYEGQIHVKDITSTSPASFGEQGSGGGSKALRLLTELADKHNVELQLSPQANGPKGLSDDQLKSWYMRHGFREPDDWGDMIRKPINRK